MDQDLMMYRIWRGFLVNSTYLPPSLHDSLNINYKFSGFHDQTPQEEKQTKNIQYKHDNL